MISRVPQNGFSRQSRKKSRLVSPSWCATKPRTDSKQSAWRRPIDPSSFSIFQRLRSRRAITPLKLLGKTTIADRRATNRSTWRSRVGESRCGVRRTTRISSWSPFGFRRGTGRHSPRDCSVKRAQLLICDILRRHEYVDGSSVENSFAHIVDCGRSPCLLTFIRGMALNKRGQRRGICGAGR